MRGKMLTDKMIAPIQGVKTDLSEEEKPEIKLATADQIAAGKIIKERQKLIECYKRISELETENARLREEASKWRIHELQTRLDDMQSDSAKMLEDCGLKEGLRLELQPDGSYAIKEKK